MSFSFFLILSLSKDAWPYCSVLGRALQVQWNVV